MWQQREALRVYEARLPSLLNALGPMRTAAQTTQFDVLQQRRIELQNNVAEELAFAKQFTSYDSGQLRMSFMDYAHKLPRRKPHKEVIQPPSLPAIQPPTSYHYQPTAPVYFPYLHPYHGVVPYVPYWPYM